MSTVERISQPSVARENLSARLTRALLTCGVISGPFFYLLVLIQLPLRSGFDIRRHAISVLSLGDLGWIQIGNFIVTGVLAILCAVGMRQMLHSSRGRSWGPVLIGVYGLGMILGGIYHPDPGLGFPPGAPAGMPADMSSHAAVHMLGFFIAFLSLIAASFIFARRFAALGQRKWTAYSAATGVLSIFLIMLGSSTPSWVGVIFAVAGMVAFGWVSALAAKLKSELGEA